MYDNVTERNLQISIKSNRERSVREKVEEIETIQWSERKEKLLKC